MSDARTPGEAAYNRWRSMIPYDKLVSWDRLPGQARWNWEKVAQAARAFELQKPAKKKA